jgi:glutamate-1-semialdehyde 2,1-aminomutase
MVENEKITTLLNTYRDEIMAKSPRSLSIWQGNRTVMPAGVGSLFRLADPFPMVIKRAKGARVWDADDHEYLDFMLGFSTMILGNTPDEVQEAIRERAARRCAGTPPRLRWPGRFPSTGTSSFAAC